MNSNFVRSIACMLLVGAAANVSAAPAPVTDVNSNSDDTLARLERMIDARNQMQLDMQRQLDQLASEMDELRGIVERNSYDLSQMLERQRDLYREVDALSRQPAPAAATPEPSKSSPEEAYTSNASENEAYESAVNLILKEKDYTGAIKSFTAFLVDYPESVYKPNAHYWLGQLYFAQNSLTDAETQFTAVSTYADSNKRADAMLKLAVIAERNKQLPLAKERYQAVISAYPESTSSKKAQQSLDKLK